VLFEKEEQGEAARAVVVLKARVGSAEAAAVLARLPRALGELSFIALSVVVKAFIYFRKIKRPLKFYIFFIFFHR
jgi:hypothetical protein